MRTADAIVIGAGVVGLAVADALRQGGDDVVVLERAAPGAGQSAGRTRIFRHAHAEASLVELAVEARRGWAGWETRFGRALLGTDGVLVLGGSAEDRARLVDAGVQIDDVIGRSVLGVLADDAPAGGAIDVRATIETLAGALGERVVTAEVLGIHVESPTSVRVETSEGRWQCGTLIVCAGADTARLAAAVGCPLELRDSLHLRATFAIPPAHAQDLLACLLDRSGAFGERVYGAPIGREQFTIGLSGEAGCIEAGDGRYVVTDLSPLLDRIAAYARRALPGLGPVVGTRLCRVTETSEGDDSFGLWRHDPVSFVAGHNLFKLAPVLGPLVAGAVRSGTTPALLRPPA